MDAPECFILALKCEVFALYIRDIICCPVDKADLKYDPKKLTLACTKCKKVYKVKDGIPVLLPSELEK